MYFLALYGIYTAFARHLDPFHVSLLAGTALVLALSVVLAAFVALLHPLGYVALALLAWFAWRGRARGDEKYAGLRILRR